MNIKPNLETFIYALVIILSAISLVMVLVSSGQFSGIKLVYQGF